MTGPRPADAPSVLIFGGSSGIGRATALRFSGQGARIALASRSIEALDSAADACRAAGAAEVVCHSLDVNDADAVEAAVSDTVAAWGTLDITVHTATVMAYGTVEEVPREVFEQVVDTAIHGTANIGRSVLSVYRRQRSGHLVVVSSLLASVTAPTMGAYVTGKWGQLGLIRTLQIETRDLPEVHISAVAPGGVSTPIYYQAATYIGTTGRPPQPVYSPDRVAADIVARIDRPRRLTQSGFANPLIILGFRALPFVYDALVGPLLKVFGYAHDGAGPTEGNVFKPMAAGEATSGPWKGL